MSEPRNIADVLIDDGRKSGIVLNFDRDAYNTSPRANQSMVKHGYVGDTAFDPVKVKESYEGYRTPPSAKLQDSFDKGTYFHLLSLQPETVSTRVAEWAGKRARTGKEWDAFQALHSGKLLMHSHQMREVELAMRELRQHKAVRDVLRQHDTEVAVFHKVGGIYVKALLDAVNSDGVGSMIDPKTTTFSLDERTIKNEIRKRHYVEQLGFYWWLYREVTGFEIGKVHLLFVRLPTPPEKAGFVIATLTTAKLQLGAARVLSALKTLEERIAADDWPAFFAEYTIDAELWEMDDIDLEEVT